ncbi:MAG: hypothetical protein WA957_16710 [Alteraurantiacibacter sp.]
MHVHLRSTALAVAAVAFTAAEPQPANAQGYPIDCAILLCLSGGWPASAPCAAARVEFIRRITPWPVEPPLQIWRCPMGASVDAGPKSMSTTRIWDALLDDMRLTLQSYSSEPIMDDEPTLAAQPAVNRYDGGGPAIPLPEGFSLDLAQEYVNEDGSSDIDISGAEFDFIRSIRVYMIQGRQREGGREGDEECRRSSTIRLGSYGVQGDYGWETSSIGAVPATYARPPGWGEPCPTVSMRSVFVDWRDFDGNYGWERVDY